MSNKDDLSLSGYFSLQHQIDDLTKQLATSEKRVKSLIKQKSKYKRLWENLRGKQTVRQSRCERARQLIAKREAGDKSIRLVDIARDNFLSYSTVKALARDYRKNAL